MTYQLPSVRSNQAGFEHLGHLAKATKHLFADELELDMSRATSFDTNMAAPLGVVLARVARKFNSVRIVFVPEPVKETLIDSRFLTHYRYRARSDTLQSATSFRRFRLTDAGAFQEYINQMLVSGCFPAMSQKIILRFKKKVFEVYQNAITHSESKIGVFVCGHSFAREKLIHFTIADCGIGVRGAVRRHLNDRRINSIQALRWALKPRNTTKTGKHPGGLGLNLIQKFSALNGGSIWIASRFALYNFCCGQENFRKMASDFPGTAVTIEINTADAGQCVLSSEVS